MRSSCNPGPCAERLPAGTRCKYKRRGAEINPSAAVPHPHPAAASTASATSRTWASVISGKTGSDMQRAAVSSETGRETPR